MSERLPSLHPPLVTPSQIPFSVPIAAIAAHDASRKHEIVEEEPYTIKCVCGFTGDDGSTIYCDRCETWQHIECYYPNRIDDALREDFAHACVDCEPRPIDTQQAVQRQKAKISAPVATTTDEVVDKKAARRLPSKSHKKKPKPTELQLNSHHSASDSSSKHAAPHDSPHTVRKPKHAHKPSQSVSSQAPRRSPSVGRARTSHAHSHPLSPITTPPNLPDNVEIHNYSPSFIDSCADPSAQMVKTNSFAGLEVSNNMLEWLHDPAKMQRETGKAYSDVFQDPPAKLEAQPLDLELAKKTISPNMTIQWQCLRTPTAIAKDVPLMELNGHVGFQLRYCQDRHSRWDEFTAPLPFVYFHPMLPLFIDTRREGSLARFVRRSCRPNATLETYLSEGREYHFWLVSDRPMAAREHITIPWDFRWPPSELPRILRILGLSEDEPPLPIDPPVDEPEYQRIAGWVHLVLSTYGGCACNLGPDCAFARFHRTYYARSQARASANASKNNNHRRKKPKPNHAVSPTSTGHATTTSRAASEGRLEDASLDHDGRSASGSSRGKPPSRDLTPTARQGSFDQLGILTQPTDRDKRKVSMIEDTFRRMELQQTQQLQPAKKRKRVSDGAESRARAKSAKSGSSAMPTPSLPDGPLESSYVDAGTARTSSHSPASAVSPGHVPFRTGDSPQAPKVLTPQSAPTPAAPRGSRPVYVDAAVQTEPEKGAWYTESSPKPMPQRRVVSLTRRLINNRQRSLLEAEERFREQPPSRRDVSPDSMDWVVIDAGSRPGIGSKPSPGSRIFMGMSSISVQGMDKSEILAKLDPANADLGSLFRDNIFAARPPPIPVNHDEKRGNDTSTIVADDLDRFRTSWTPELQDEIRRPPSPTASSSVNPTPLAALPTVAKRATSPEWITVEPRRRWPSPPPPPPPLPATAGSPVNPAPLATLPAVANAAAAVSPAAVVSPGNFTLLPSPAANGVSVVNPSPVKKKMSLSDWKRVNKTAARPTTKGTTALKTVLDDKVRTPSVYNMETNGTSQHHEGSGILVASPILASAEASSTNGSDSLHKS